MQISYGKCRDDKIPFRRLTCVQCEQWTHMQVASVADVRECELAEHLHRWDTRSHFWWTDFVGISIFSSNFRSGSYDLRVRAMPRTLRSNNIILSNSCVYVDRRPKHIKCACIVSVSNISSVEEGVGGERVWMGLVGCGYYAYFSGDT